MDEPIPPGTSTASYNFSSAVDTKGVEEYSSKKCLDSTNRPTNLESNAHSAKTYSSKERAIENCLDSTNRPTTLESDAHSTKTYSSKDRTIEILQASDTDKDYERKTSTNPSKALNNEIEGNCETTIDKNSNKSSQFSEHFIADPFMQPDSEKETACIVEKNKPNDVKDYESEKCISVENTEYIEDSQGDLGKGNEYINADNSGCLPVILNVRGNANDFDTSEENNESNDENSDESTELLPYQASELLKNVMDKVHTENDVGKESASESISNVYSSLEGSGSTMLIPGTLFSSTQETNMRISSNITRNLLVQRNESSDLTSVSVQSNPVFVHDKSNINGNRPSDYPNSTIPLQTMTDSKQLSLSSVISSSSHPLHPRSMTSILRPTKSSSIIGTISTSIARSSVNAVLSNGSQGNCNRSWTCASPRLIGTQTILVNTQRMRVSAAPLVHEKSQTQTTNQSSVILDSDNVTNSQYLADPTALTSRTSLNYIPDTSSNNKGMNRQDIIDSGLLDVIKKPRTDLNKLYVCEVCGDDFYHEEFLKFHLNRNVFKMTYFCTVCSKGMIFSNKCSFLQHVMKEDPNWQLNIPTGRCFMKLMSYMPSSKHDDPPQPYISSTSSQMKVVSNLLQSSSLTSSVDKVYPISIMTQAGANDSILSSEKNQASHSSLSSPGVNFSQPSSILQSGATFQRPSSLTQSRSSISQPPPKSMPGTSLPKSSSTVLSTKSSSMVLTTHPQSSSVTQSVSTAPKSSSTIEATHITTIPKTSSMVPSPKSSSSTPVSNYITTISPSSSMFPFFKSPSTDVATYPQSSSVTQPVATIPKSSSMISAALLQPASVTQSGVTLRLPLTTQLIISPLSVSHANDNTPFISGANLSLNTVSKNSSPSQMKTVSNHSMTSISCDRSNSTPNSKANVSKSAMSCNNNTPLSLQSSSDSSPQPSVSFNDSSSTNSSVHIEGNLSQTLVSSNDTSSALKCCPVCKLVFPNASQLKLHFQRSSSHTYFCNICQMTLFNLCHLAAHKSIHTIEEQKNHVICPECGITLPYSKVIFDHLDTCGHFNVTIGITCHCKQVFTSINRAKFHILEKHLDILHHCRTCSKAFPSKEQLFAHYRSAHPLRISSVSTVVMCTLCREIFFTCAALQSHIENELSTFNQRKQRAYQCMLCPQTFVYSSKLNLHMEKDHTHKPKRCTLCFALFKSRQNLVSHIVSKSCEKKLPRKLHVCIDVPPEGGKDIPFKDSVYLSLFKTSNQVVLASERGIVTQQKISPSVSNTCTCTSVDTSRNKRVTFSLPSMATVTVPASTIFSGNLSEKGRNTSSSHTAIPQKSLQVEKRRVPISMSLLDRQKYQCHSCKICLVGSYNFKKHMSHHKSNELKTGRTHCIICKKMIVDSSICSHMEEHQKCGVIICTLCHRRDFANMRIARDHAKNWCYYKVENGWGEACFSEKQLSSSDKDSMNNGKDNTDAENRKEDSIEPDSNENQPLLFPCLMCGLAFSNRCAKDEHVSRVHEGRRTLFFCLFCKRKGIRKSFHKRKMASLHISRKHRIVEPSAISELIQEEEQNISSGQVIPVEVLAQGDSTDTPPPKRLRIEAEGAFLCGKCGFSDTKRDAFELHIKTHNPRKEPQCPECGLCFTVKAALKKHLFAIHKIKNVEEYMKEREIGDEDEDFVSDDEEMETVYVDIDTVTDFDNRAEPKSRLKSKTISITHPDNPLECNVCYKRFSSESVLKSHIRNHGMAFIRSRRHNKSQGPLIELEPSSGT